MHILVYDFFDIDNKYIFKAKNSKQVFGTQYLFVFVWACREY